MREENRGRVDKDKSLLSDGESTPNNAGVWLIIAVIVAVIMVLSNRGGAIASLIFLFGPIILIILAVGKTAEWAGSRHLFDKPGGERQPASVEARKGDQPVTETQDPAEPKSRE